MSTTKMMSFKELLVASRGGALKAIGPDEMAAAVRVNLAVTMNSGGDVTGWIRDFVNEFMGDLLEMFAEIQSSLGEHAKIARTLRAVQEALGTVLASVEATVVAQMPRASRVNLETGEKEDVIAAFDDDLLDVHVEVEQPTPGWRGWDIPKLVAAVCEKMADQQYEDGAAFADGLRKYLSITGAKASIKDLGLKRADFGKFGPPVKATPKLRVGPARSGDQAYGPDDPTDEDE